MLFSNKSLGMEIFRNGLSLVVAGGSSSVPFIDNYVTVRFPVDVLKTSLKETNIIDASLLKSSISESYLKLCTKIKTVSLSIPDTSGKVLLVDIDTPLKSKEEGVDHVRWKLKKNFPIDLNDVHLDYQVLRQDDSGSTYLLVGIVSKNIVQEYENLLLEIGLEPSKIDFTSFNLYRLFSSRLDIQEHLAFVSLYRDAVSVLIFQDGVLDFSRNKFISSAATEPGRLYREINSSFLVYSDTKGGWKPKNVFYFAANEEREMLKNVIGELIGSEPYPVDTDSFINSSRQQADHAAFADIMSALGAATRNLK